MKSKDPANPEKINVKKSSELIGREDFGARTQEPES